MEKITLKTWPRFARFITTSSISSAYGDHLIVQTGGGQNRHLADFKLLKSL
ncbi:MAG: hypothetical protein AB7N80_09745 [Bdellovibrionales bacterium]